MSERFLRRMAAAAVPSITIAGAYAAGVVANQRYAFRQWTFEAPKGSSVTTSLPGMEFPYLSEFRVTLPRGRAVRTLMVHLMGNGSALLGGKPPARFVKEDLIPQARAEGRVVVDRPMAAMQGRLRGRVIARDIRGRPGRTWSMLAADKGMLINATWSTPRSVRRCPREVTLALASLRLDRSYKPSRPRGNAQSSIPGMVASPASDK